MFNNVLVGVDGRPNGRDGIALAEQLVEPEGKLTLVHVHTARLHPGHAVTPQMVPEERAASHELLVREREQAHVSAELVSVVAMSPGHGLHQQAEEQGSDLLVVGSSHRGLLGRVMLGDHTRAALNGAPCAVAIASRGYAAEVKPIATIGIGYNGSPESELALQAARDLAARHRATISALNVVGIPTYAYTAMVPPVNADVIDAMLEEANSGMRQLEGVKGQAVYGLAGEELAAFGDSVDLLVVGSRSYGPWRRLVLGSTSDYLERHARCPLLVLPRPDAGEPQAEGGAQMQASSGAAA